VHVKHILSKLVFKRARKWLRGSFSASSRVGSFNHVFRYPLKVVPKSLGSHFDIRDVEAEFYLSGISASNIASVINLGMNGDAGGCSVRNGYVRD
jgi:hypothetical protein